MFGISHRDQDDTYVTGRTKCFKMPFSQSYINNTQLLFTYKLHVTNDSNSLNMLTPESKTRKGKNNHIPAHQHSLARAYFIQKITPLKEIKPGVCFQKVCLPQTSFLCLKGHSLYFNSDFKSQPVDFRTHNSNPRRVTKKLFCMRYCDCLVYVSGFSSSTSWREEVEW